jgi:CubicO group peptidase (beta-lactamase class C family)
MDKHMKFSLFLFITIIAINEVLNLDNDEIIKRIQKIIEDKNSPLLGGGLAVIKDNKTLFCKSMGKARLNPDGSENKTANEFVKYRTASISKLFTAIAIWQLEEQGKLDINDEASKYLNFKLRNPHFPDTPITIAKLLSHTSSIAEHGGNYNIPYNHHISEFFNNTSEIYYDGSYSKKNYPGYFNYVNMNYCLLGTIIENITHERFDLYMKKNVLEPLNITGGFNLNEMPIEILNEIGTLYEKLTDGRFDIDGKWTPRMDDFTKGYPKDNYSEYVIGTNGALFGPMGSLRISMTELTHLVYMFLNNGTYNGKIILKPETVDKMLTIIWKYDENKKNGNTEGGYDYAYAGGPSIITNIGKNRLHRTKNLNFSGHTAEAYGLFGGLFFDRVRGYGVVYRGNGVSKDLSTYVYDFSPYNRWAIDFIELADEIGEFYPEEKKTNLLFILLGIFIPLFIIIVIILVIWIVKKKKGKADDEKNSKENLIEENK